MRRFRTLVFLTAFGVFLYSLAHAFEDVSPAAAVPFAPDQAIAATGHDDKAYVLGASNLIHIKVLGEDGLQQTFRVDEAGYITHPLLGRIQIGGKTVAEAEEMIRTSLAGDYILNPYVSIFVIEHSRFSVLGEVRKPGNYEILGPLSLVEGISIAGGFTPVADEKKVKILRRDETGEKTLVVDIRRIMEGKQEGRDVYIKAGDVIDVPKSFF